MIILEIIKALYTILSDVLIVFNLVIWGCVGVFVLQALYKKEKQEYER